MDELLTNGAGIGDLMRAGEWLEQHGRPVFTTKSSFDWFLRSNHERLVREGVVLPRKGRGGTLVSKRLGEVVRRILSEQALAGLKAPGEQRAAA